MHLLRRDGRFTFRKRIPADLVKVLGATPIRIALPPSGARHARRLALQLAAAFDLETQKLRMSKPEDISREALIAFLRAAVETAHDALQAAHEAHRLELENLERKLLMERIQEQLDMRERLGVLGVAINHMSEVVHGFLKDYQEKQRAAAQASSPERALAEMQAQFSALVQQFTPPEQPEYPTFGSLIDRYCAVKGEHIGQSKYVRTLATRLRVFVDIVGDRPLNEYRASDLDNVKFKLLSVPANWTKRKMFVGMTFDEMIAHNRGLRQPLETLSWKTVSDGYLRPLRAAMTWMCNEYQLPDPWRDVRLARPRVRHLRPSAERQPFDAAALNRIFAEAAKRDRKDDRWLPLLGAFTGARVGESIQTHEPPAVCPEGQSHELFKPECVTVCSVPLSILQQIGKQWRSSTAFTSSSQYVMEISSA